MMSKAAGLIATSYNKTWLMHVTKHVDRVLDFRIKCHIHILSDMHQSIFAGYKECLQGMSGESSLVLLILTNYLVI